MVPPGRGASARNARDAAPRPASPRGLVPRSARGLMSGARCGPSLRAVDPFRRRPTRPPRADVVLAAVFLVLSLVQVALDPITDPAALSYVVALGSALPVAWRRVQPAL